MRERERERENYCWNSMFMDGDEGSAMVPRAVSDKTIVVPKAVGSLSTVSA